MRVYDNADKGVLILGEPGAGKTILLLELTRAPLQRARQKEYSGQQQTYNQYSKGLAACECISCIPKQLRGKVLLSPNIQAMLVPLLL